MTAAPALSEVRVELARRSFRAFLRDWHFKNRETGQVMTFGPEGASCESCDPGRCKPAGLWPGQAELADQMEQHPWLFALKAGKLGFTELECAYDAWVALFRQPNARIHLFSKDALAAKELLRYVKFGIGKLPPAYRVHVPRALAGGDTTQSLMFKVNEDPDDIRTVVSFGTSAGVAIDQTASHSHVDELSHMGDGEGVWNSVATTVAPGGTCHIVTRGAGEDKYSARLWKDAMSGVSQLAPFFSPWTKRPDRDRAWLEKQAGSLSQLGLRFYAPATWEDALAGDDESAYIPLELWDRLADPRFGPGGELELRPGDRTPIVVGVDAAVTSDSFAVVAVSRHPDRARDVVIRKAKQWRPQDFPNKRIDFATCNRFVRFLCQGGCAGGHPKSLPLEGCGACEAEEWTVPRHNVVLVTYDPYQLEDESQGWMRDRITYVEEFDQGTERAIGDALMYRLAFREGLTHDGNPDLREHIGNAKAKLSVDDDSRMRIVKKFHDRKVDLAVAAAMAVKRCLDLNI